MENQYRQKKTNKKNKKHVSRFSWTNILLAMAFTKIFDMFHHQQPRLANITKSKHSVEIEIDTNRDRKTTYSPSTS